MLRPILLVSLLAIAGCTQAPAVVELKGNNTYARNGTITNAVASNTNYSAYSPSAGSNNTQSTASISSVGVSDLTPPASNAPAKTVWNSPHAANTTDAKPVTVASNTVNPWTHTQHETAASDALDQSFHLSPKGKTAGAKEPMVSDVKPVKTAKLDSIVDNESDEPVQKVAITPKTVKADSGSNSFMWPVSSKKILSEFGPKGKGKINDGINIASAEGEPVWAAADGEVVYVGNELQGYGNMVLIKHSGNKTTSYAHLSRYTVDKYDRIKQGDIIGYVGNSGNVKEPQLHFAVHEGKDPVDPLKLVKRDVASLNN